MKNHNASRPDRHFLNWRDRGYDQEAAAAMQGLREFKGRLRRGVPLVWLRELPATAGELRAEVVESIARRGDRGGVCHVVIVNYLRHQYTNWEKVAGIRGIPFDRDVLREQFNSQIKARLRAKYGNAESPPPPPPRAQPVIFCKPLPSTISALLAEARGGACESGFFNWSRLVSYARMYYTNYPREHAELGRLFEARRELRIKFRDAVDAGLREWYPKASRRVRDLVHKQYLSPRPPAPPAREGPPRGEAEGGQHDGCRESHPGQAQKVG